MFVFKINQQNLIKLLYKNLINHYKISIKDCFIKLIHLKKEFFLEDLNLIKEQSETRAQPEYSAAFKKFDSCFNLWINELFNDKDKKNLILKKSKIIWYNSARLNREVIIRACDDFYGCYFDG